MNLECLFSCAVNPPRSRSVIGSSMCPRSDKIMDIYRRLKFALFYSALLHFTSYIWYSYPANSFNLPRGRDILLAVLRHNFSWKYVSSLRRYLSILVLSRYRAIFPHKDATSYRPSSASLRRDGRGWSNSRTTRCFDGSCSNWHHSIRAEPAEKSRFHADHA